MPFRSPLALLAWLLLALAAVALPARPTRAAAFTDAAGRRVMLPDHINRVLPADRNAEVLVFVLAPDKLAGLERLSGPAGLVPRIRNLPVLGWRPRSDPANIAATARQAGADVIIDAGSVTPAAAAFADEVQQRSGIPYILVDDSFSRVPALLRDVGVLLGVAERARHLGREAEHAIAGVRGRLLVRPADSRPHVYYGLGSDGMTTPLPGSAAGAAIAEAGAINVAGVLGQGGEATTTPGQLLHWDPPIIIAERRAFYEALRHNAAWSQLSAVRNKRVYLEPTSPFGWIEGPAGVNRLIGLSWLSSLFYPDAMQEDLRTTTCDFYDTFYRIKLTNGQVDALVVPAGAPLPEASQAFAEPAVGLAPTPLTPPPALPQSTPGATPGGFGGASAISPSMPGITLPGAGPSARCTTATGPSPLPLPGLTGSIDAPPAARPVRATVRGLAPNGRRNRPSP